MVQAINTIGKLLQAGQITKGVYDTLMGDHTNQGLQQVDLSSSVGQTGNDLINQYRPQSLEDESRMNDMRNQNNMINEGYNDKRRQQNYFVDTAMAEQSNRAKAASDVLSAYNQARNTTSNFLSSLSGPGVTQR